MGLTALTVAAALQGCTSNAAHSPATSNTPLSTPSPSPVCTGRDEEAVLRAFFDDLSSDGDDLVTRYFTTPQDFTRWWDPTAGSVLYDSLQAHLTRLQRDGVTVTVTGFTDHGFGGSSTNNDVGGEFTFEASGQMTNGGELVRGGKGGISCETGKLKVIVMFT
jgi:hypothetical protein